MSYLYSFSFAGHLNVNFSILIILIREESFEFLSIR